MDIFPAIDLQNGRCVRLTQGDFDTPTVYEADPRAQAQSFARMGARWLHVVDLDGARAGAPRQHDLIADIARASGLKTQVGGGIRDEEGLTRLLDAGIERAVIGSLALKEPARVAGWLKTFGPERIVLALDVRLDGAGEPEVLTHGWQQGSRRSLWQVLDLYADSGLKTVLCTDVAKDGMLQGVNLELYRMIGRRLPRLDVLASGGVAGMDDITFVGTLGVAGVVVGKAIYEGRIDLARAIRETAHAR